ncbi:hypothetical protein NOVOSPHI9U_10561 [Novosphingobium sp. 9U]|nr:hypothetical protein NOVOSPHI9U_10561 [Novosphingobium sp. 9U]
MADFTPLHHGHRLRGCGPAGSASGAARQVLTIARIAKVSYHLSSSIFGGVAGNSPAHPIQWNIELDPTFRI